MHRGPGRLLHAEHWHAGHAIWRQVPSHCLLTLGHQVCEHRTAQTISQVRLLHLPHPVLQLLAYSL